MIDWHWALMMVLLTSFALSLSLWPLRKQKIVLLLAPLLFVLSAFAYWHWGAWSALLSYERKIVQQHRAQLLLKNIQNPDILIQKLETHLKSHPESARAWYLLGRLYASQRRWEEATTSFQKAYSISPKDELIAINFAQALFSKQTAEDRVTAVKVLDAILQRAPNQPDALAMMAMDAQWQHHNAEALGYWRRLLTVVPEHSEEAVAIRKAMIRLKTQK